MRFWHHSHREPPEEGGGIRWFGHLDSGEGDRLRHVTYAEVSVEASRNRRYKFAHAEVELGPAEVKVNLALPRLFSVFAAFKWRWMQQRVGGAWSRVLGYEDRGTAVKVHSGKLWLTLFAPDYGSTSEPRLPALRGKRRRRRFRPYSLYPGLREPWFAGLLSGWERSLPLDPLEWLFGRRELVTEDTVGSEQVLVSLPEGSYPARLTLKRSTYSRRHGVGRETFVRHDLEMLVPVPVPGKGENSYDCEDDAFYSQSGPESTAYAAVASMVSSCLRQRELYGGRAWRPAAGWPEGLLVPGRAD